MRKKKAPERGRELSVDLEGSAADYAAGLVAEETSRRNQIETRRVCGPYQGGYDQQRVAIGLWEADSLAVSASDQREVIPLANFCFGLRHSGDSARGWNFTDSLTSFEEVSG